MDLKQFLFQLILVQFIIIAVNTNCVSKCETKKTKGGNQILCFSECKSNAKVKFSAKAIKTRIKEFEQNHKNFSKNVENSVKKVLKHLNFSTNMGLLS